MHICVSSDIDKAKFEEPLKRQSAIKNLYVGHDFDYSFHGEKIFYFTQWNDEAADYILRSNHAVMIDAQTQGSKQKLKDALRPQHNLSLQLSSRTAYQEDIVDVLVSYLRQKNYSEGLIEVFMTIAQELITNAVIHGNLALNVNLLVDLPREDQNQVFMDTFEKIQTALDDPDLGTKTVTIHLNCYDETLLLDVQDQGAGFDFEAFQKKYETTQFQKGMDLIFLLSKDIQYDQDTKTMSVLLEDPDKKSMEDTNIDYTQSVIGIYTSSKGHFRVLQSMLRNEGMQKIVHIEPTSSHLKETLETITFLITLSDMPAEEIFSFVQYIRTFSDQMNLPILCQKTNGLTEESQTMLSQHVNDFLSDPINMHELLFRIRANYTIYDAQNKYQSYFEEYLNEIKQCEKTISYLEKSPATLIENKALDTQFFATTHSTKTNTNLTDFDHLFSTDKRNIPYGHGFYFSLGAKKYFMFLSMKNNLSSILIISFLKGIMTSLLRANQVLLPSEIIDFLKKSMRNFLQNALDVKIICSRWEEDKGTYIYDYIGHFLPIEYSQSAQKVEIYKQQIQFQDDAPDQVYEVKKDTIFMIFDADIRLNFEKIQTYCSTLELSKNDDGMVLPELKSDHDLIIPCFITYPLSE